MQIAARLRSYPTLFLCLGILSLSLSSGVYAKPIEGRFGFGVSHVGPDLTPQISIALKSSSSTTLAAHAGFANENSNSRFDLGARFSRNLFIEDNQDFFFYCGASLNSRTQPTQNASGYTIEAGAGSEIFFNEFPNFGLNFGGGFALINAGGTRIESRIAFGMHYYF